MPHPFPTELPNLIKPGSPALHADSLSSESPKDQHKKMNKYSNLFAFSLSKPDELYTVVVLGSYSPPSQWRLVAEDGKYSKKTVKV